MAEQESKKRNGVLDLLKVVLTLCIILHHYQQLTGAKWEQFNFWDDRHFYFGYLVEFFFLISGIVIVSDIDRIRKGMTFKTFFGKKYLRFLPVVALSVICYEVLLVVFRDQTGSAFAGSEINWGGALVAALSLQNWVFPNPGINNPIWYISVLLLCYLIFYILIKISERFEGWKLYYSCAVVILLGCAAVTNEWEAPLLNQYTGRGFYAFFFGICLAWIMSTWGKKSRYFIAGTVMAGISMALIFLPGVTQAGNVSWYGANLVLLYVYYPAMILFLDNPGLRRVLSGTWVTVLARISLGAFIWHHVIHTAFVMYMIISGQYYDTAAPVIAGLVICVDYLAGLVSYMLIERPFMCLVNKRYEESGN